MAKAGRLYLQLDVNYHEDARLVDVSPLAELLYIRCLCACKRLATNGVLSRAQIARICFDISSDDGTRDTNSLTRELTRVGLLEDDGDDWLTVPSWVSWNEVSEAVSAARAASGRVGGQRSGEARRERSNLLQDDEANASEATKQTKHSRVEKSRVEKSNARSRGEEDFESDFNECWQAYPRKIARKAALKAYIAQRRKAVTADTLLTAVQNFAEMMRREQRAEDRILYGSTFFGPSDRWEDFTDPPPKILSPAPVVARGADPLPPDDEGELVILPGQHV